MNALIILISVSAHFQISEFAWIDFIWKPIHFFYKRFQKLFLIVVKESDRTCAATIAFYTALFAHYKLSQHFIRYLLDLLFRLKSLCCAAVVYIIRGLMHWVFRNALLHTTVVMCVYLHYCHPWPVYPFSSVLSH